MNSETYEYDRDKINKILLENELIIDDIHIIDDMQTTYNNCIKISLGCYILEILCSSECCEMSIFEFDDNYSSKLCSMRGKKLIKVCVGKRKERAPIVYTYECTTKITLIYKEENKYKKFNFYHVVESNGYYFGVLEIILNKINEKSNVKQEKTQKEIMIVIGLPGSGKSSKFNSENYKNHIILDEFLGHDNKISEYSKITDGKIIIIDARFCNIETFNKYIPMFQHDNYKLVLYKNDPDKCINNVTTRHTNDQKMIERLVNDINNFSKIYDTNNYPSDSIMEIKDVFC